MAQKTYHLINQMNKIYYGRTIWVLCTSKIVYCRHWFYKILMLLRITATQQQLIQVEKHLAFYRKNLWKTENRWKVKPKIYSLYFNILTLYLCMYQYLVYLYTWNIFADKGHKDFKLDFLLEYKKSFIFLLLLQYIYANHNYVLFVNKLSN